MTAKQVTFRCPHVDTIEGTKERIGGIAMYNNCDELLYIICGCCGGIFEPYDVKSIRKMEWIPISQEIIGE